MRLDPLSSDRIWLIWLIRVIWDIGVDLGKLGESGNLGKFGYLDDLVELGYLDDLGDLGNLCGVFDFDHLDHLVDLDNLTNAFSCTTHKMSFNYCV